MIHYHGTPISGGEGAQLALAKRHAMVSFAAPETLPLVAEVCQSFALDNGAFSAWKSGAAMDLEGFAAWIDVWKFHPGCDWYLITDVIDGSVADNDAMRARWWNLVGSDTFRMGVPVWHLHESLDVLRGFMAWPRVALGSSGQFATVGDASWWRRIAEAMDVVCEDGRPLVKLHGLRMLDPTVFSHLPLASADSTNVARNSGMDSAWNGPYAPRSRSMRAQILMDRIEGHASANRWCGSSGVQQNLELIG